MTAPEYDVPVTPVERQQLECRVLTLAETFLTQKTQTLTSTGAVLGYDPQQIAAVTASRQRLAEARISGVDAVERLMDLTRQDQDSRRTPATATGDVSDELVDGSEQGDVGDVEVEDQARVDGDEQDADGVAGQLDDRGAAGADRVVQSGEFGDRFGSRGEGDNELAGDRRDGDAGHVDLPSVGSGTGTVGEAGSSWVENAAQDETSADDDTVGAGAPAEYPTRGVYGPRYITTYTTAERGHAGAAVAAVVLLSAILAALVGILLVLMVLR